MLLGFLVVFLASQPTTEHSRYLIGVVNGKTSVCGPKGIALPELALLYQTRAKGDPGEPEKHKTVHGNQKGKKGELTETPRSWW